MINAPHFGKHNIYENDSKKSNISDFFMLAKQMAAERDAVSHVNKNPLNNESLYEMDQ